MAMRQKPELSNTNYNSPGPVSRHDYRKPFIKWEWFMSVLTTRLNFPNSLSFCLLFKHFTQFNILETVYALGLYNSVAIYLNATATV